MRHSLLLWRAEPSAGTWLPDGPLGAGHTGSVIGSWLMLAAARSAGSRTAIA